MAHLKFLVGILAAVSASQAAQLLNFQNQKDVIPNSYVVVMNDGVSALDFESHVKSTRSVHDANTRKRGIAFPTGGVKFTYDIAGWRGYSGKFDNETLQEIIKDPKVKYVEPDRMAKALGWVTQSNAPTWGLGRISHRSKGVRDYVYDSSAGEGVTMYAVDTGVDISHPEFEGRATWGINVADNVNTDQHGHGTHTAGTLAGKTYGVAKKAKLVVVKVLNRRATGSDSGIIRGMNWAVDHARANGAIGKAVMNLSIGSPDSSALNEVATKVAESGIFVAAAAGNRNEDARNTTPAAAAKVCAVGASAANDVKARFSNHGPILAIFAPGVSILSSVPGGRARTMSGTSMAAPHVAGVAATLISSQGVRTDKLCDRIKQMSAATVLYPGVSTTNKLLYNGSGQ
ncbi:conserved hypothetical protein [Uncinocarpus reesii 1704]|uniref:Uncharacterized protein n=1 Tax=Uncinocarpus reesii (strain UAMH 1704) TaxID=336963 RepID=C4JSL8_UNCRE|nr:uncharacterized protein UREG_05457 [Uncinocarpus reesii 1704]EEP80615.1 conserved hypothetical protein [Uncinocarpus reesii 1704]